ncbi:MAG: hypothetical protein AAF989_04680 [Planctomycetota bacterium]
MTNAFGVVNCQPKLVAQFQGRRTATSPSKKAEDDQSKEGEKLRKNIKNARLSATDSGL